MQERSTERENELRLLAAVLAGDGAAEARFVRYYGGVVELAVRQVLRGSGLPCEAGEVEDLVHEIWLSIFERDRRSLRRFEPDRGIRVSTWIGLLSRHKTVDRLRRRGVWQRMLTLVDDAQLPEAPADEPLAPELIEQRERRELAQRAFSRLRQDEQRFLEAWYLEERDPAQLAAELGVTVGTVYTRRYKLQQKLARGVSKIARAA